jgi:hypothetical protein
MVHALVAVDLSGNALINDENINYSKFECHDESRNVMSVQNGLPNLSTVPSIFLADSSTTDVLGLMHERTK